MVGVWPLTTPTERDALVKGGAIPDDGQIDKLAILRGQPVKGGAVTVGLAALA